MKRKIVLSALVIISLNTIQAQVGIATEQHSHTSSLDNDSSGIGVLNRQPLNRSTIQSAISDGNADYASIINDGPVVHNAVSPNGDNKNDFLAIEGIDNYPKNRVSVFNRWGAKVFETSSYNSAGNIFDGFSQGKATIGSNKPLSDGTYYYILEYESSEGNIQKAGYLYLSAE